MDAQTVRTALGALQGNPDAEDAWSSLATSLEDPGGDITVDDVFELLDAARERHAARGEPEAAFRLAELTARLCVGSPREVALRREQARILIEDLYQGQKAIEVLEYAVTLPHADEDLRTMKQELEKRSLQWEKQAATYVAEAENSADESYQSAMLMRAAEVEVSYAAEPNWAKVEEGLERAIRLDASNIGAAKLLETVYRQEARFEDVARVLERMADRAPDKEARIAARVRLSRLYINQLNAPAKAAQAYERVLELEPTQADAMAYASEYYSQNERWDDLVRVYERPLKVATPDASQLGEMLQVAMLHWKKRNAPGDAEVWFDKIRRVDPTHELTINFYREYKGALSDDAGLAQILQQAQRALPKQSERATALGEEIARLSEAQVGAQKSIEQQKSTLRTNPENPEAREALKQLYKQTQGHNALVELLRQDLERAAPDDLPKRLAILREIAAVYREYIKSDTALVGVLNQIVQLDGKLDEHDVGEVRELAALHERLGRPRELLVSKKLLAEIVPDIEEKKALYRQVGRAWLDQFSQVQHAIEAYAALYAIDKTDPEAIERLDELYRKRRSWKELYDLYSEQLQTKEGATRAPILREMAQLAAERLNDIDGALGLYREILELEGARSETLSRMEKYAERSKNWKVLAEALERRLSGMPADETRLPILTKLGGVYSDQLDDAASAIHTWERVVEVQPGNPRAMRVLRDSFLRTNRLDDLDKLYARQNDLEGLAEVFSTAADRVTDVPSRVELSYRAARVYEERLGQASRAVRSYERILSVQPDDRTAVERLLGLYEQEEKWARVPQLLEALFGLVDTQDEKVAVLSRLVRVLSHHLSDRKGAAQVARRAYELAPEDPRTIELLDGACRSSGNWDEMVQALGLRLQALAAAAPPPEEGSKAEASPRPVDPKKTAPKGRRKKKGAKAADEPAEALEAEGSDAQAAPVAPRTGPSAAERAIRLRLARIQGEELGKVGDALAALRILGEELPGDTELLDLFEALVRRERREEDERWLLGHRAAHGTDPLRATLDWAAFEEASGHQAEALALFKQAETLDANSTAAAEAVIRLAMVLADPKSAAASLSRLCDLTNGDVRAAHEVHLARIYAEHLQEPQAALRAAESALRGGAERGQVIAVLKLLTDAPAVRGEAARLLSELYEQGGDARQESDAVRAVLAETTDSLERKSLFDRLITIHGDKLREPSGAFQVALSALNEFPTDEDLWERAALLSTQAGRPTDLLDALRQASRRELPADSLVLICRRAAAICEDVLHDVAGSAPFYERILSVAPDEADAWNRLRQILTTGERWSELEDMYLREVARTAGDASRQIELLNEVAMLAEDILGDPERSVGYHKQILGLDDTYPTSLEALDRLYLRLDRKTDLATLLERRIELATDSDERTLRIRLAKLAIDLHDPERAIGQIERVLEAEPGNYEARDVAEILLQIGRVRVRAAVLLEGAYELKDEIRDLVRVLGVRVEALRPEDGAAPNPAAEAERRDLLRRIATLRDDRLHDDEGSFDVFAELVPLDPMDTDLRQRLIDSGRRLGKSERVVSVLLAASEVMSDSGSVCEILVQTARVQERTLEDVARAILTLEKVASYEEQEPEYALQALRAIEVHLGAPIQAQDLASNLERQIRLEPDLLRKAELRARLAQLYRDVLGNREGAIVAWEGRLEDQPDDAVALVALSELYEVVGRFVDLAKVLETRREAARQDTERHALTRKLAELWERLEETERAIECRQLLLDEAGPSTEVLQALARLFARAERYHDLAEILERQADELEDEKARLTALAELGVLRVERLGDRAGALDAHRRALSLDMQFAPSREALLSLLKAPEPTLQLEVAHILEPIYLAEGNYEGQLQLIQVQSRVSDDPGFAAERLQRATEICEDVLRDTKRGFQFALSGLRLAVETPELPYFIAAVDRLAGAEHARSQQVTALQKIAREIFDSELQQSVYHRVGELLHRELQDSAAAIQTYSDCLERYPEDRVSLEALDELYQETRQHAQLLDIISRRVDLAADDASRKPLLFRKASLLATSLERPSEAIVEYESILDLGMDMTAISALTELYTKEARYDDLSQLLLRQIDAFPERAAALRVELAQVALENKGDVDAALDELASALALDGRQSAAITMLEALAGDPRATENLGRVGELLEPVYVARGDHNKLLVALRLRFDATQSSDERRELVTRIAQIHEEQREDYVAALEINALLLADDPSDELTVSEMERLASVAGAPDVLARLLALQVEKTGFDDPAGAQLARRAGQIYLDRGDLRTGIQLLQGARQQLPEDRILFGWLEGALTKAGTPDERIALYRSGLESTYEEPLRIDLLRKLAALCENQGQLKEAIEAHREVLDLQGGHVASYQDLERLYTAQEQWQDLAELYENRMNNLSGQEALLVRLQLADLLDEKLSQPEAALDHLETALGEMPANYPTVQRLERFRTREEFKGRAVSLLYPVYQSVDDWRRLIRLSEDRFHLAEDPQEKADILKETASLWEHRGDDLGHAMTVTCEALRLAPDDETLRTEIERLAAATGDWWALADTYTDILSLGDGLADRVHILRRVAEIQDKELDNPRGALERYFEIIDLEGADAPIAGSVVRLATLLGDWQALEKGLVMTADTVYEPSERRRALLHLGEVRRDTLENVPGAIEAFESAFEQDESDTYVCDLLTDLHAELGHSERLVELCLLRADASGDDIDAAFDAVTRAARIYERDLSQVDRAIDALRRALEYKPLEPTVLADLNRLLEGEELWNDLLDNLRLQASAATDGAERRTIQHRIAAVLRDKLREPDDAVGMLATILEDAPNDVAAADSLFALADAEEHLKGRIAQVLLDGLGRAKDPARLVKALELALLTDSEPAVVLDHLRRIAALVETELGDGKKARVTLLRAVAIAPSLPELHQEVIRLSASSADFTEYAGALETVAADCYEPALASELWVRLAKVHEERLGRPDLAAADYEKAAEQIGDQLDLMDALDRLYTQLKQSERLVELLERKLPLARSDTEQGALLVRAAREQIGPLKSASEGLGLIRRAIERDPSSSDAVTLAASLLDDAELFEDAFELLDGVYRERRMTADLSELHRRRMLRAQDPIDRIDLRRSWARVLEDECLDPSAALAALAEGLKDGTPEPSLIDEIERLLPVTGQYALGAEAVLAASAAAQEKETARDLATRAAEWFRDHVQDEERARSAFQKALTFVPDDDELLEQLARLQEGTGQEANLLVTLSKRVPLAPDDMGRIELLRRVQVIAMGLGQAAKAEEAVRAILDIDDQDLSALADLRALRSQAQDHQAVYDLLLRQAGVEADGRKIADLKRLAAAVARDQLKRLPDAVAILEELFDDEPNDEEVLRELTRAYEAAERWDDLGRLLERLMDAAHDEAIRRELSISLARLQYGRVKNSLRAIELLEDVLRDDVSSTDGFDLLVKIYEEQHQTRELFDILGRRADYLLEHGDLAGFALLAERRAEIAESGLGDSLAALEVWETLLEKVPSEKASAACVRLLLARGELSKACLVLEDWTPHLSGAAQAAQRRQLAELYRKLERPEDVLRSLVAAAEATPDDAAARASLRAEYQSQGHYVEVAAMLAEDAERAASKAAQVDLFREAAQIYHTHCEDFVHAAEMLRKAAALAPEDRGLLLEFCDALSASGQGDEAVAALSKLVETFGGKRSKELADVHRRLGTACLAVGQEARALEELEKAFRIEPGNIQVLAQLGDVAMRLNDLKKAQQMYRALLLQKLEGDTPISKADVFYRLGMTHIGMNEAPKAKQMFERAIQADPGHAPSKAELGKL